jgi:WD40 repeat protein
MRRLLLILMGVLGVVTISNAQTSPVITPQNIHEITLLEEVGRSVAYHAAYSGDGKRLAISTLVGVWFYQGDTEKPSLIHPNPASVISESIALNHDGSLLAISDDRDVQIWDTVTWQEITVIRPDAGEVRVVDFALQGDLLAIGLSAGDIILWDTATDTQYARLDKHGFNVRVVDFTADGSRLASLADDFTLIVWDTASASEIWRYTHEETLDDLSFSLDGTRLAWTSNKILYISDATTGQIVSEYPNNAFSVRLSTDGSEVIYGDDFALGDVSAIDLLTGQERAIDSGRGMLEAIFNPVYPVITIITGINTVLLTQSPTQSPLIPLDGYIGLFYTFTIQPLTGFYALVTKQGLYLFEPPSLNHPYAETPTLIIAVPNSTMFVSEMNGNLIFWDINQEADGEFRYREINRATLDFNLFGIENIAISSDGQTFAYVDLNDEVHLTDFPEFTQKLATFTGHTGKIDDILFSADGSVLIASGDGQVSLWDVASGELIHTRNAKLVDVKLTPDLQSILLVYPKSIAFLDLNTQETYSINLPDGINAHSGAISPDGSLVVAVATGKFYVYEVESSELLYEQPISIYGLETLFSPDGRHIAIKSLYGSLQIWGIK